ncbi:HlyD family secretion protein [Vibrio cholerae]|uniref:HlyD family secretion protein n=1 Tax=Vibrio cholerae TaxID=666 RepID=UPI00166B2F84|nr:HlyD family efflux transporter periplasmic adaptor subunit [Vibrio cholerae]GFK55646.1 Multidrug resistance protein MdtN [Vibrio cholerae]GFK57668.1 Multidrug resistance protein MdtN [Vibrio cholerae]GFK61295.1 Multidrug resistance protein MdtN [Vibrio cholerae]GFK64839.1 Multidrug resistance protein MdtN [Vibrio cholerae]GFK69827.1 Multidrug resistance protein MdtN [Vibrio cholerae]
MIQSLSIASLLALLLSACSAENPPQALGTLERDRITFSATSNEIIRELPISEGEHVKVGDVLVKLDSQIQTTLLTQALAQQAKAQASLTKLTNGERPEDIAVAKARAQHKEAELTLNRKAELVAKRLISQSEVDAARSARDSAQAELASAHEEFTKLTAGARIEDIEQAKAELAVAQANVTLQQQKLDELTILATRDGILDSLPYHLGERVSKNAVVAIVQADRLPYARVYVPATHRAAFVVGQTVTVHVDGIKDQYQGKIRWVANEPSFTPYYALTEKERSRLMYLAEVDLPESAMDLPSGLPAQVDLP